MSNLIDIQVYEDALGATPIYRIKLPAVPRQGDSITLPDAHYVITEIYWQAIPPKREDPIWPDYCYYMIRMVVTKKLKED